MDNIKAPKLEYILPTDPPRKEGGDESIEDILKEKEED